MSPARALLLATAALLPSLPLKAIAADTSGLRTQLALATEDSDNLARIELLRRILDAEPGDTASHQQLVELWLAISDYDMAEAALNAWPAAPAKLAALTRARILRDRDKDVPGAVRVLRAYLLTTPADLDAHEALVSALLATDNAPAQIAALDALIALQRNATHLIQRANAKLRAADYAGALADAKAAQALEPDSPTVKRDLPAFERLDETLHAIPPLDAALAKHPNDLAKRIERAWWLRYGGMLARSLADADAALAFAPDSVAARLTRARARYMLNQLRADDARRDEWIDVTKPHALDTALAIATADLALAEHPTDTAQLRKRARALNEAGQYLLAQRDSEAALALSPTDAGIALEALYAATMLGQDPAPLFRRIEQMKPPKAQLALANGHLADLYFRQSNLPLALEFADRSLTLAETEFMLRVKAAALQRLGRPDEAATATRRANALHQ
ncbi:MAG: hypothetical protein PHC88_12330 [Terrimicrobiaceae bacterium]|nr:hypothetical protein [Terrimicrobiaceae bacterium]